MRRESIDFVIPPAITAGIWAESEATAALETAQAQLAQVAEVMSLDPGIHQRLAEPERARFDNPRAFFGQDNRFVVKEPMGPQGETALGHWLSGNY